MRNTFVRTPIGVFVLRIGFVLSVPVALIALLATAFAGCHVDLRYRSAKKACLAGAVGDCVEVAKTYDSTSPNLADFFFNHPEEARIYYDQACRLGSIPSCDRFGRLVIHEPDEASATKFVTADAEKSFTKACDGDTYPACFTLGRMLSGVDDATDLRAVGPYTKACSHDILEACYMLGVFRAMGWAKLPQDDQATLALFKKACGGPPPAPHDFDACDAATAFEKTGKFPKKLKMAPGP